MRIDLGASLDGAPPGPEHWTIRVSEVRDYGAEVDFDLFGSRHGFDGAGSSGVDFVSDSGRIVIAQSAWFVRESPAFFHSVPAVRPGDEITFAVRWLSRDLLWPRDGAPVPVPLVQVAEPGPHTLTLRTRDRAPFSVSRCASTARR